MNPTSDVFEKRMAALEGGAAAVSVSSGKLDWLCMFFSHTDSDGDI